MNKNSKLKYGTYRVVGKDDIWPKPNENTAPLKETSPLENYVSAQKALLNKGDFAFSENEWLKNVKDGIKNHDDFSYDVNSDALYQQLVNQYVQQGKMASADVMGKAAGMTGGYGNSYANTVGNQVYQSYLQQLNNEVPALYESALNQHNMKKQALYDEYALLMNEYDREYDEYNRLLKSLEGAKETDSNNDNNSAEIINDIRNKAKTFTDNDALDSYLTKQRDKGLIDTDTMGQLYFEYEIPALTDREWKVVDNGGINAGGIDHNAVVKDEYGNEFSLGKLIKALTSAGMDKEDAKEYVLNLQAKLGI